MEMRVKTMAVIATVVLLAVVQVRAADRIDRVLAIVNGMVITESDVRAALSFGLVAQAPRDADPIRTTLDQLIRRQLILGEVVRFAGADPDPAQVSRAMQAIRALFPTSAAYEEKLKETAMSEARLRDHVDVNIRVDDYMSQRFGAVAEPSDQDVADYYGAHRGEFTSGGRQLTLDEAKAAITKRLRDERRSQTIDDWVARLRRRAEVTDLYFAQAK